MIDSDFSKSQPDSVYRILNSVDKYLCDQLVHVFTTIVNVSLSFADFQLSWKLIKKIIFDWFFKELQAWV